MIDTNKYKGILETELKEVEKQLGTVAKIDKESGDWQAKPTEMDVANDNSDENDNADKIEEFGTNNAITNDLEIRYNEIKEALGRIEKGTYGKCEVDGMDIEEDRLNANPAAKTCVEHAK